MYVLHIYDGPAKTRETERDRQKGGNSEKTEIVPLTLSLGNNYRDKNGARLRIMHWGIASVMT